MEYKNNADLDLREELKKITAVSEDLGLEY